MDVFGEIRKQASETLEVRFPGGRDGEGVGSASTAADKLDGMTVLFFRLRNLNKKVQVGCKESKAALAKEEERVAGLKLTLDSMRYRASKLNEECTALSN